MQTQNRAETNRAAALEANSSAFCRAFAGVIRRHRQQRGWSVQYFSMRTNVSHTMLSWIERDLRVPSLRVLPNIAAGLGLQLDTLILETYDWLNAQPDCCRTCNYGCLEKGELKWLDANRQCIKTANNLPSPPNMPAKTGERRIANKFSSPRSTGRRRPQAG